jgi:hypothetical protein
MSEASKARAIAADIKRLAGSRFRWSTNAV